MAVFTELTEADAQRVADSCGLGTVTALLPVAAGSVNSNYMLKTDGASFFLRLYEEQETDGVAYEWALLEHLRHSALPIPARLGGGRPGELRAGGKPVAVFECAPGEMWCQAGLGPQHLKAVGEALALAHRASAGFGWRRESRFEGAALHARWAGLSSEGEVGALRALVTPYVRPSYEANFAALPRGPIHGDLFRDNVLWEGDVLSALIDWESAADGPFAQDLAIVLLAWCYGDGFDWSLARALVEGYGAVRSLEEEEERTFFKVLMRSAARFAVTRVTDFHLREAELRASGAVFKDFRRFARRIEDLLTLGREGLRDRLFAR